jgi:hypothetical protein
LRELLRHLLRGGQIGRGLVQCLGLLRHRILVGQTARLELLVDLGKQVNAICLAREHCAPRQFGVDALQRQLAHGHVGAF